MPAATISVVVLVALFVTLIPTTIGALLSAIGIAGMDRLVRFNVLAMSGRAVEAAGDVDTLLLDKTGTDHARQPPGDRVPAGCAASTEQELADAAQLASLADETPEGRSIVVLAKDKYGIRGRDMASLHATFMPVHRAEPHERRRGRRLVDPQGRRRCHPELSSAADQLRQSGVPAATVLQPAVSADACARSAPSPTTSRGPAARRWPCAK